MAVLERFLAQEADNGTDLMSLPIRRDILDRIAEKLVIPENERDKKVRICGCFLERDPSIAN